MPYHLDATQLRVMRKYVRQQRNQRELGNSRLILLQHLLPTTEEFIRHLSASGAAVHSVIAKPYSIDPAVLERLTKAGFPIRVDLSYYEMESTDALDQVITSAVAESKVDGRQIAILEVGGYFCGPLRRMPSEAAQYIAGVVEDTTFGHNRYLEGAIDIPVPVFSVARSPLKEIEARFIGRDAVLAVERILRDVGVSIAGRRALVIGYGMIGSNVARALRNFDLDVQVYDKHDHRNLAAFIDGFYVNRKSKLIAAADIIFAATADRALTWEEIEECKDNVILASVGSKDTEFDVKSLKEQAMSVEKSGQHLETYCISNSKNIILARGGTAVNFLLPSLPTEVLDLVFSEILLCLMLLLKVRPEYPPGIVYESASTFKNEIAKDWLRSVNPT